MWSTLKVDSPSPENLERRDFDASIASAAYADVVKANRKALDASGLKAASTEDIFDHNESNVHSGPHAGETTTTMC